MNVRDTQVRVDECNPKWIQRSTLKPQWELSCISSCTPRDPLQGMQLHQLFLHRHILWTQQSTSTIHHLVTRKGSNLWINVTECCGDSMYPSKAILGNVTMQVAPAELVVKLATNACGLDSLGPLCLWVWQCKAEDLKIKPKFHKFYFTNNSELFKNFKLWFENYIGRKEQTYPKRIKIYLCVHFKTIPREEQALV